MSKINSECLYSTKNINQEEYKIYRSQLPSKKIKIYQDKESGKFFTNNENDTTMIKSLSLRGLPVEIEIKGVLNATSKLHRISEM